MVKIEVGIPSTLTVKIETEDYELEFCKAKMSRSLKNLVGHYILNKIPTFLHLGEEEKIQIVLPTNMTQRIKGLDASENKDKDK